MTIEDVTPPSAVHSAAFRSDVVRGLGSSPRAVACKWFYDREGSQLFDQITEQAEYYPTAAETELLRAHAVEIAAALGPGLDVVELGSGSSVKTRLLLDALVQPRRYVPVDISTEHLHEAAERLRRLYTELTIRPLVADYSASFVGPDDLPRSRRVVFFPGSSIGNFEPLEAVAFLERCRALARPDGVVLVGVDLPKDRETLERAYDDRAGVTRRFNLNLLVRMRRELGASLRVEDFEHRAVWEAEPSRIEMRLLARVATEISIDGRIFRFRAGEHFVTEHCYKHDEVSFAQLASRAGLRSTRVWYDPARLVSMHWLEPTSVR